MIPPTMFNEADADRAYDEWGANCGPGALAGILGMTLDGVRPHLRGTEGRGRLQGGFESKGYTNPTLMYAALESIGRSFTKLRDKTWPTFGLVRVQWEGPWTEPGVPLRARYRYTHWIGTALASSSRGIFDINCINNGTGWVSLEDWSREIAPHLIARYPKANGRWHICNALEVSK